MAQSVSSTGLHQHDEQTWAVRGAPGPAELIWNNLGMVRSSKSRRQRSAARQLPHACCVAEFLLLTMTCDRAACAQTSPMRTSRGVIMLVLFWLLTLFYMIPVTAIQVRGPTPPSAPAHLHAAACACGAGHHAGLWVARRTCRA